MLTDAIAAAASIPLPRPRPVEAQQWQVPPVVRDADSGIGRSAMDRPEIADPDEVEAGARPEPADVASACRIALPAIAAFEPLLRLEGPGACGVADPVRLEAVILPDRSRVDVAPPAELRCEMATAVAQWIREDVTPAVTRLGTGLRAIENFDSYSCRGRNRVFGARISEHGRGNALDVRAVMLADGTVLRLTDAGVDESLRHALRSSACERFTTVLGPGSDGYHEDHVHLDLAERRSGHRICQWELRAPTKPAEDSSQADASRMRAAVPLPIPRPQIAAPRSSMRP